MVHHATYGTRLVSFQDDPSHPAQVWLGEQQEVLREERPTPAGAGRFQRFLYVHGPMNVPVRLIRRERLGDGSEILVRYEPDLEVLCGTGI
ncbi:MAG: hypothetical protein M5U26_10060 [Planctomycetota bacterium]|nr:hypothetical protein [Planctomycetota bacterium]